MNIAPVETLKHCRLCKSKTLLELWDLKPSPYGDLFVKNQNYAITLPKIGLTLQMCESCKFVQLGQQVDIDKIYKDYLYNSQSTPGLSNFYKRFASSLISSLNLSQTDLIIDVGSNDGTALTPFIERGFKVLGIEPASTPAAVSISAGIPTIISYLNIDSVSETLTKYGKAKLVMANYVSANVTDPVQFFTDLKSLLSPDGAISILTGYHPDQFAVNMFDYINHDHLSYFTLKSALILADLVGLKLISVERVEHKGGSINVIFKQKDSLFEVQESVSQLVQREGWLDIEKIDFFENFKNRITLEKGKAQNSLPDNDLIGLGASISTTHLLHQFEIGDRFKLLLDDNPNKIETFSPGFGLEVKSLSSFQVSNSHQFVMLAWQHGSRVYDKIGKIGHAGQVYYLLPKFFEENL